MPTIQIDTHTLHYITAGNPNHPAVLMLHGWGSYHGIWMNSIKTLENTHYCIALDHLGLGYSDKPPKTDYSIRAQAQRALKVMDELGINQFQVMGHSMGGQIAMIIASELAPSRVTKLVNVDGVVTGRLSAYVRHVVMPTVRFGYIPSPTFCSITNYMHAIYMTHGFIK